MVEFKKGTYGFTVLINGRRIGYITEKQGLLIDNTTLHGPLNLSASDLMLIAKQTARVTGTETDKTQ